jgi:endonuclease/exonuclease/phosphatase family metal-dependent hydrolase
MKRRDLLQAIPGALVGAGATGLAAGDERPGPVTPDAATGTATATTSGIDDCAEDDGVSLRCLGKQLDPERPAERLGGHRPPELRSGSVDRDLDYLTPVHTPTWLETPTVVSDTQRKRRARRRGRDAGMMNGQDKGLLELYRYPPGVSEASVREVVTRHRGGEAFSMLFLNAALFEILEYVQPHYDDIRQRAPEIGRMIRNQGYDIVGLNEVWYKYQRDAVVAGSDPKTVYAPDADDNGIEGNSGLLAMTLGDDGTPPTVVERNVKYFDLIDATLREIGAAKGWLHLEIDLGVAPGNVDLFVTHLNAGHKGENGQYRRKRLLQLLDLGAAIQDRNQERPENVSVLGGDFNVLGNLPEYDVIVDYLDDRADMQDAWLTRGGEVSMTSYYEDQDFWPSSRDAPDWPSGCRNYEKGCHCDDYQSAPYPQKPEWVTVDDNSRLDYVFVERPKDDHEIRIDLKRVRRKLFPRLDSETIGRYTGNSRTARTTDCANEKLDCGVVEETIDPADCDNEPYLSDHMGLEVEILASDPTS